MTSDVSRIGEVKLRLRVPAELEAEVPRLRQTVERDLLVAVVEALERRIHEALGSRAWVRIRHLAVRWSLDGAALTARAERLGDELARELLSELASQPAAERLRPRSSAIVAFTSPRHADAARLADAADGLEAAWCYAEAAAPAQLWDAATAAGGEELAELVRWLERMERLEGALAFASAPARAAVIAASPAHAATVALIEARRAVGAANLRIVGGETAAPSVAAAAPSSSPIAPATGISAPPQRAATETGIGAGAATATATETAAETATVAAVATTTGTEGITAVPRVTAPVASTARPSPSPAALLPPLPADALPIDALDALSVETRHAGLFYLAGRALEIDLAEALWAAGVPEGDVLAHIALALIDDAGDPAWRWFGGVFDRKPALPTLPAWALAEVGATVQHALGRRLLAFGVVLTPDQLSASLDALAADVPHRLAGELATVHLLSRCAAALATITAARLRVPASWPVLRAVTTRPGRLVVTPTELRVLQPAAQLDLDHRRAGLDHDPGRVAWLTRHLRLEFVGLETL